MPISIDRLSGAIHRHGFVAAAAMAAGLPLVAAGKRIDRWMRGRRGFERRVDQETERRLDMLSAVAPASDQQQAGRRIELATSLRRSSRFCYEKKVQLFLFRQVYPRSALPAHVVEICRPAADALATVRTPRVLAAGCRDVLEVVVLRNVFGTSDVIGLDLFSLDEAITCGDMLAMPFADKHFDVVVTSHSLEHTLDPREALRECVRVLRPRGILAIEVPVKDRAGDAVSAQAKGAVDRWDFHNLRALKQMLEESGACAAQVLYEKDSAAHSPKVQLVIRLGED